MQHADREHVLEGLFPDKASINPKLVMGEKSDQSLELDLRFNATNQLDAEQP
jgi:hypothetical protein